MVIEAERSMRTVVGKYTIREINEELQLFTYDLSSPITVNLRSDTSLSGFCHAFIDHSSFTGAS